MRIGIGIDTGGTYTDAVVYDFDAGEVIAAAKALTTREDLSIGILEALDKLPRDKAAMAEVISLSTTLATNACVEDKGGSAKLIFFGGDRKVIDTNGSAYGLPPSKDMYIQESHTTFSGGFEREVDWAAFNAGIAEGFDGLDGVGIIEANAIRNSAVVEKKARELFARQHDIPVVCSHELFNELNCLQRGASTLLNARLVPVIREFLQAISTAMAARGLDAAVAIV
ncbi:MAG: hydantoinase/oxoprolinase family protein, partial [Clostridiales bacterium]|nr:hydantoinase/oxoprolinase family protein [Clostridiales bacterium]